MKRAVIALVTLLMLVSVSAFSQSVVPQSMNFQGRLSCSNGTPVLDATYPVTFTLCDALHFAALGVAISLHDVYRKTALAAP